MHPFQSFSICFGIYFGVFRSCPIETAQPSPLKQVSNQEFDLSCHSMRAETISSQVPSCRPRGRRAGLKTKAEEWRKINNIPVLNSPQVSYANYSNSSRRVNLNNLIPIPAKKYLQSALILFHQLCCPILCLCHQSWVRSRNFFYGKMFKSDVLWSLGLKNTLATRL